MTDWLHQGVTLTDLPEGMFGFVYCITNRETGRKYIGRKQFTSIRSKLKPGSKRRTRATKESGWRSYYGSCVELKDDVKLLGPDCFTREVLRLCVTRGELTYGEVEFQVKADVLTAKLEDGSPAYYNGNICSRWFRR